jgi:serine/threonine-protein kinase HipA
MTSKAHKTEKEAFVWIWLPGETKPVVAGRLEVDVSRGQGNVVFNYGKSYLERVSAGEPVMPIYEPELPLRAGILPLPEGLTMPGCIRDAASDAWGRRVIINKTLGSKGAGVDTAELGELTYLLESGSDRIGALDFQRSPTEYVPRVTNNINL